MNEEIDVAPQTEQQPTIEAPIAEAPKADAPAIEAKPRPDKMAPVAALIEERLKRQEFERRASEAEKAHRDLLARLKAQEERDDAPDRFADPEGHDAWIQRQIQRRAQAIAAEQVRPLQEQVSHATVQMSAMQAERALGEKRWKALNAWLDQQSDEFHSVLLQQPDPYGAAAAEWRRVTTFQRLGGKDIDELIEEELAKRLAAQTQAAALEEEGAAPAGLPLKANAPRSFASARSAAPGHASQPAAGPKPLGEILAERPARFKR